jgi:hypothetical protein
VQEQQQCAEMEWLTEQNNAMPDQQCQEPSVALHSARTFQLELFVEKLRASAQRDQNVVLLWRVVNWYVNQDNRSQLEPGVEKVDSSRRRHARLMVLALNKSITHKKDLQPTNQQRSSL